MKALQHLKIDSNKFRMAALLLSLCYVTGLLTISSKTRFILQNLKNLFQTQLPYILTYTSIMLCFSPEVVWIMGLHFSELQDSDGIKRGSQGFIRVALDIGQIHHFVKMKNPIKVTEKRLENFFDSNSCEKILYKLDIVSKKSQARLLLADQVYFFI